jgi:hypothetical protein
MRMSGVRKSRFGAASIAVHGRLPRARPKGFHQFTGVLALFKAPLTISLRYSLTIKQKSGRPRRSTWNGRAWMAFWAPAKPPLPVTP